MKLESTKNSFRRVDFSKDQRRENVKLARQFLKLNAEISLNFSKKILEIYTLVLNQELIN